MEILKGMEYTIVKMPENVAMDSIDALVGEFVEKCLTENEHSEYLLDMQNITQLHRAALTFIVHLHAEIEKNGCSLCIAGLQEAVENALQYNLGERKISLYKNIMDFERQKELIFDLGDIPEAAETQSSEIFVKKKPNMVLMEPNLAFRQNQRTILNKLGITNVVEAKEIGEVIKKVRYLSYAIDVLLLDFETIKLGAVQFIRTILTQPSCANAIVICTLPAASDLDMPKDAAEAGVKAVILKNFNLETLQKTLNSLSL